MSAKMVAKHQQWWLAVAIILSGFLTLYNSVALNLAIPAFGEAFDCSLEMVQWIMVSYTLAMGVLSPTAGYFADRFSCKYVFAGSMVGFAVVAILAGLSQSIYQMIVLRVLQGAFAAFTVPCALMVVYQYVPAGKRATFLSIQALSLTLGPAFGPVMAGYLLGVGDWSWLLYLNVLPALATAAIIWYVLPYQRVASEAHLDVISLSMVIIGTVLVMISFNVAGRYGMTSWQFWAVLLGGGVGIGLFVQRELKSRWPILNFSVLKYPAYTICLVLNSLVSMALCLAPFVLTLYFQSVLGLTPWISGLLLLVPSVVSMAAFPVAQRIYSRTKGKGIIIGSCLMIAVGNGFLGRLTPETTMVYVMLWLCVRYIGVGLSVMPITDFGMRCLPTPLTGHGSSFLNWCKMIATSLSLSGFTLVLTSQTARYSQHFEGAQAQLMGINDVFFYSTLLMLAAVALAFALKKDVGVRDASAEENLDIQRGV